MAMGMLLQLEELAHETALGLMGAKGVETCQLGRRIGRGTEDDCLVTAAGEEVHVGNDDVGFHKIMKKTIRIVRLQFSERPECVYFHERHHLLQHVLQTDAHQHIRVDDSHTGFHSFHFLIVHLCLFFPEAFGDVCEVIAGGMLIETLVGGAVFQTAQMLDVGAELDIVEIALAHIGRHP